MENSSHSFFLSFFHVHSFHLPVAHLQQRVMGGNHAVMVSEGCKTCGQQAEMARLVTQDRHLFVATIIITRRQPNEEEVKAWQPKRGGSSVAKDRPNQCRTRLACHPSGSAGSGPIPGPPRSAAHGHDEDHQRATNHHGRSPTPRDRKGRTCLDVRERVQQVDVKRHVHWRGGGEE